MNNNKYLKNLISDKFSQLDSSYSFENVKDLSFFAPMTTPRNIKTVHNKLLEQENITADYYINIYEYRSNEWCYAESPVVYVWFFHILSLGLIPIREKIEPTIFVEIIDDLGKVIKSSHASNSAISWTWSPLIFSKKSTPYYDIKRVDLIYEKTLNKALEEIK